MFALFCASIMDIKKGEIADEVHIVIIILGIVHAIINSNGSYYFLSFLKVAGGLTLIAIITPEHWLGGGDTKLIAAMTMFFGIEDILLILLISIPLATFYLLLKPSEKPFWRGQVKLVPPITISTLIFLLI